MDNNILSEQPKKVNKKFVLVSKFFDGFGFCLHTPHKVIVAYNDKDLDYDDQDEAKNYKHVGEGIIKSVPLQKIMDERSDYSDWYWVFDGNHSVEEADLLREEGFKVFGSGTYCDMMENDRGEAIKIAESVGLPSPMWKEFKSKEDGIKFLEENEDKAFVFKPNDAPSYLTTVPTNPNKHESNESLRKFIRSLDINDFILQERVDGVEVNVEVFAVDGEVKCAQLGLESKRISHGDTGCMTGCGHDICTDLDLDCDLVQNTIAKFFPLIKKEKYTGFADVNVIVGDQEYWFIEFCWRVGFNFHPNYFANISRKDFFTVVSEMIDGDFEPDVR